MKINIDNIIKDEDSLLKDKSVDVCIPINDEDRTLLLDMLTYVRNSRDEEIATRDNLKPAVGIAAPQVGVLKKMIAIVYEDEDEETHEYALVNPTITSHSVQMAYLENGEACLSVVNNYDGLVPRYARITVKAYDLIQDKYVVIKASKYFAIILQHEIDHLHGILYYDHINKDNPFKEIKDAIVV